MSTVDELRAKFDKKKSVEWLRKCLGVLGWTSRRLAEEICDIAPYYYKEQPPYRNINRILHGEIKKPTKHTFECIVKVLSKEKRINPTQSQEEFIRRWISGEEVESTPKRITLWVLGSDFGLEDREREIAEGIVSMLPAGLVKLGVRVVMGESIMLREFAENYRNAQISSDDAPNAIILLGKLRGRDLRDLFTDAINCVPDLAILIGGAVESRAKEEYKCAIKAGIPIIPIPSTGGLAKQVKPTANRASHLFNILNRTGVSVDVGDLTKAILEAVKRYK